MGVWKYNSETLFRLLTPGVHGGAGLWRGAESVDGEGWEPVAGSALLLDVVFSQALRSDDPLADGGELG